MKTTQDYVIGNALDLLPEIPNKYVDLILSDLPYGTTQSKWDTIIPLEPLWEQYKRILKNDGVIVLTANQPFTTLLISSNIDMYRYIWTWNKVYPTGFLNAKRQPLRVTEDIIIFYNECCKYNPQMTTGKAYKSTSKTSTMVYSKFKSVITETNLRYPKNIITIPKLKQTLHQNQKPTELFEYLIKTYSNEGDVVHDSTMGSGVTMEACRNLNRNFIGFELDPINEKYYKEISKGKSLKEIYHIYKNK